jgi:Flp pilus assembly protein CpaB
LLVALITGAAVTSLVHSAEQAGSRWSDTRLVVVARHDLAPGDVVDAGAVVVRRLPRAAVADAAGDTPPVGAVVRFPIAAGEPVVNTRLAPDGLTGVAALVPEGNRAVAVPVGPAGTPPVREGDRVDLVALTTPTEDEPTDATPAAPATTLAEQALVVDTTDTTITVAVPTTLAPAIAYAAAQGLVALTLVGG